MADMQLAELDHRRIETCSFVLLDPLRGDADALAAWEDFRPYLLAPPDFVAQSGQLPELVDLRGLPAELHNSLLDLLLSPSPTTGGALCVAVLEAPASTNRLVAHFRSAVAPHFPGGRRGIFRYYDPVVFEHLTWILDDRELASLFGPVRNWMLRLRDAWYVRAVPSGTRPLGLRVRAASWSRIQRISAIHAVLEADPRWRTTPVDWGPKVEALLIRAEQHQLLDRDDAVAFATQGLRWHPDIDQHPRVAALIKNCAGHPARYRRLTAGWTDSDWTTIASELDQTSFEAAPPSPRLTKPVSQGAY